MIPKRSRRIITLLGTAALVCWASTMALWIKRLNAPPAPSEASPVSPIATAVTEWMEIYLKGDKIGYSERHLSPAGAGYLATEEMILRLNLIGRPATIKSVIRATLDRSYSLKGFYFLMTSGAVSFQARGNVEAGGIKLSIGDGKRTREVVIPVSGPVVIGAAIPALLRARGLEIGHQYAFSLFDPSIMAQKEASLRVIGKENLEIKGIPYIALRLEGEVLGQRMIFWLDGDGGVLKEEGPLGLTLVRASEAAAVRGMVGGAGEDLYRLAAVPVEKKIWGPERLSFLKLRVEASGGMPFEPYSRDSGRQLREQDIFSIRREEVPEKEPYATPCTLPELAAYLRPEPGIESDHPAIVSRALSIAAETRGPVRISKQILEWVYAEIAKMPVVSVPSAVEVLQTKMGDCNEHAFLAAALLRAAGIPARVCVGLVYKEGAFYYHAWNEVYFGSWISIDAVSNQMPADPTHLKLAHGGLDKQASILGLMGKIRIEVLAYGYD